MKTSAQLQFPRAAGSCASRILPRPELLARRRFSFKGKRLLCTSVSKKVPTTLGEILADELKTETSLYHRDEMLDAIPQGFKLLETDGDSNMELVTQYKGEDIAVVFSITEFRNEESGFDDDFGEEDFMDSFEDDDVQESEKKGEKIAASEDDDDEYDDEDDEFEEEPEPAIDFNVHIGKGKKTLTFECTTDGNIYSINTVNISNEDDSADKVEYEGPNFEDLEENLQEGFFDYLHERGINYDFARYLFTVAIDKEQREYMTWLKDLETFVAQK